MPVWRQVWPSLFLPCAADRVYPEAIPKTAVDQSDAERQIFRQAKLFSEIRRWTLQVNQFLTGAGAAPVVPGPLVGAALGEALSVLAEQRFQHGVSFELCGQPCGRSRKLA